MELELKRNIFNSFIQRNVNRTVIETNHERWGDKSRVKELTGVIRTLNIARLFQYKVISLRSFRFKGVNNINTQNIKYF